MRVDAATHHLAVPLLKLGVEGVEGEDLGGAYEGEVERVEGEEEVFIGEGRIG